MGDDLPDETLMQRIARDDTAAFDLLRRACADAVRKCFEQVQSLLQVGQGSMSGIRHDAAQRMSGEELLREVTSAASMKQ